MYRIIKSRNQHYVQKRFLWVFWITLIDDFLEKEYSFDECEEWVKKAIATEAWDSTQVIRIYERP